MFENSCEELDNVVAVAKTVPGVLGARLSGGGFGGSAVVLVKTEAAESAAKAIAEQYKAKTNKDCEVSMIQPSIGASIVYTA
jgi:galactokinase